MAVDYSGATVNTGDQVVLAGVVREIDGDLLLITTADGKHAMRVKSTDAMRVAGIGTGGGGVTDHGALTGLADNDHPQYALVTYVDYVAAAAIGLIATKQDLDATLTALAGLATGADKLAYSTGTDTFAQTDFTSFGRDLVGAADRYAVHALLAMGALALIDSVDSTEIANDAVTDAKLRNSSALSVIGRATNSTGDPADIAAGTDGHVLRRSGTALGFGTLASGAYADNTIAHARLVNSASAGRSVLGRSTNSAGAFAEIATTTDGHVLRLNGTTLGFGTIATAGIADAAVTLAKQANLAAGTTIGRATGAGTGVPVALTGAQLAANAGISTFGSSLVDDGDAITARATLEIQQPSVVQMLLSAVSWTPPETETFFQDHQMFTFHQVDLKRVDQVRLFCTHFGAGAAGTKIRIRYMVAPDTDANYGTFSNWLQLGSSGHVDVTMNSSGSGYLDSGWVALASGAKDDVALCITALGGDGATSGAFFGIHLQTK